MHSFRMSETGGSLLRSVPIAFLLGSLFVASVTSVAAFGQDASGRKGLTWGKESHDHQLGVDTVSCQGHPKSSSATGLCDTERGDTSCSEALPILCFVDADLPRPDKFKSDDCSSPWWSRGHIGLTAPVRGDQLDSLSKANQLCVAALGERARMARGSRGVLHVCLSVTDMWELPWSAYGNVSEKSRFWVYSSETGNCWDSLPEELDAVKRAENLTRMDGVKVSVNSTNGGRPQDDPYYGPSNLIDGGKHRFKGLIYTDWASDPGDFAQIRVEFPRTVTVGSVSLQGLQGVPEWALDIGTLTPEGDLHWTSLDSQPIRFGNLRWFPRPWSGVKAIRIVLPGPALVSADEVEVHGPIDRAESQPAIPLLDDLTHMKGTRVTVSSVSPTSSPHRDRFFGAQNLTDRNEHVFDGLRYTTWVSGPGQPWIRVDFPHPVNVAQAKIEFPLGSSLQTWAIEIETQDSEGRRSWVNLPSQQIRGFRNFYRLPEPQDNVAALRIVFPEATSAEVAEIQVLGRGSQR